MKGRDLKEYRAILGRRWGLGRPLFASELARALRMGGQLPSRTVRKWEQDNAELKGPTTVAIDLFLSGALPPDGLEAIKKQPGGPPDPDDEA